MTAPKQLDHKQRRSLLLANDALTAVLRGDAAMRHFLRLRGKQAHCCEAAVNVKMCLAEAKKDLAIVMDEESE